MSEMPCPDCPEFLTYESMRLLLLAIKMGIGKNITSINCPKYKIEREKSNE